MKKVVRNSDYDRRYKEIAERERRRRNSEQNRLWREAHPEKTEEYKKKCLKCNMTPEAWEERLEAQRQRRRRAREQ